jgi:hypothetical protein
MAYRLGGLNGMEDDGVDDGEVYTREGGRTREQGMGEMAVFHSTQSPWSGDPDC